MTKIAAAAALAAFFLVPGLALAQAQPPIQSAQDAACREEAKSRVFSGANPPGVDMMTAGRGYYEQCMRRSQAAASPAKAKGKAKRSKRRPS